MNRNDWRGAFNRRKQKSASERGKRMAKARWTKFHSERARLDALDPIRVGGNLVRRVVVIDHEVRVKERSFYEFDRPCDFKRKLRELGLSQACQKGEG